jgi:hypothetical protein
MISLFIKFLPYVFIVYFLYRSIREPVFFLGIPFLMYLRTCIFFEQVMLFRFPFRSYQSIEQNPDVLLVVWLIIFWIIFRIRSENSFEQSIIQQRYYKAKNFNILDYTIISLVFITLIGFFLVLKEYYILENVYDKFIILMSLFIGYFIIKDVASRTKIEVLCDFFYVIVIINSIASGLYFIHQGLHIPIYSGNEYATTIFEGVTITRTFWFIPPLWSFSIVYLLVFKKEKSFVFLGLLAINLLAIYISYNRSTLLANALLILLYFLFVGFKQKDYGRVIRNFLIMAVAGVAFFFVLSNFLPASTNYFISRFKELDERPVDKHSNNLVYRFSKTEGVIDKMNSNKILFGYGSVTETQMQYVKIVDAAAADMGWAAVVFRWGFLGFFLFVFVFVVSIIFAFRLFLKTEGMISQLALLLLLTFISQVFEGLTSWAFMFPNRLALGLFCFGVLSALLLINRNSLNEVS